MTKKTWSMSVYRNEGRVTRCVFHFDFQLKSARLAQALIARKIGTVHRGTNLVHKMWFFDGQPVIELRSGYFNDREYDKTAVTKRMSSVLNDIGMSLADPKARQLISGSFFVEHIEKACGFHPSLMLTNDPKFKVPNDVMAKATKIQKEADKQLRDMMTFCTVTASAMKERVRKKEP